MLRTILCLVAVVCVACGGAPKPSPEPQPGTVGEASPAEPTAEAEPAIRVAEPTADAVVTSPLVVTGEARGSWFFEATFPVTLLDADGKPVVRGFAQAQGEWMTEQFVPFKAELAFTAPAGASGTLLIEKANASGLPEHAGELRIPIRFP
jgi:hypothetical protein